MPRIKDGFKGERAIVLPAFLIEELKQDPLGSELYITDIGYYPHACFHYRKRDTEEVTEFILIYCMEGEGGASACRMPRRGNRRVGGGVFLREIFLGGNLPSRVAMRGIFCYNVDDTCGVRKPVNA